MIDDPDLTVKRGGAPEQEKSDGEVLVSVFFSFNVVVKPWTLPETMVVAGEGAINFCLEIGVFEGEGKSGEKAWAEENEAGDACH